MSHPALSLIPRPPGARGSPLPCPDEAVRTALKRVVTSKQFAKAHRCTTLLTYLVERVLDCGDHATAALEHEIGIAVFQRDPASYFPGDDPIVRVQAGRLRLRLAAYYAEEGAADPLRITVPQGSYQARLALAEAAPVQAAVTPAPVLMFSPLTCLGGGAAAAHYTAGLNDELGYRLYRTLPAFSLAGQDSQARDASSQRGIQLLEGTVRQDAAQLRVSLHLRHGAEGTVLWYGQFDGGTDGSIAGQEQMADRCIQALQRHMPAGAAAHVTAPA
jgi:TolB-like protein